MRTKTKFQVLKAIVGLVAIDVVHRLVLLERPPERFRHHDAMLRDISTAIAHRCCKLIIPD